MKYKYIFRIIILTCFSLISSFAIGDEGEVSFKTKETRITQDLSMYPEIILSSSDFIKSKYDFCPDIDLGSRVTFWISLDF